MTRSVKRRAPYWLGPTLALTALAWPDAAPANTTPVPAAKPQFSNPFTRPPQVLSAADIRLYKSAFAAADKRDWGAVSTLVKQVRDQDLIIVLTWLQYLRKGPAEPADISRFTARQPDWPLTTRLHSRQETLITESADDRAALAHFKRQPPRTLDGQLRHAQLLAESGANDAAANAIRQLWRARDMSREQEQRLLSLNAAELTAADHAARVDTMIWAGRQSTARRALSLTRGADRKLGDARYRLRFRQAGVDAAIARLTPAQAASADIVYERVRWRRRAGQGDGAVELLLTAPTTDDHHSAWWTEKRIHIRRLISENRVPDAYALTVNHGLKSGARFAEAEFLAGWIALRFLDQPTIAEKHFRTLAGGVRYPVSVARGTYWLARALSAQGRAQEAREWYARAAAHPTTYYGQLAAQAIGQTYRLPTRSAKPAEELIAAYSARPLPRIIARLADVEQHRLARLFLTHLVKGAKDDTERRAAAEFTRRLNDTYLLLLTGKLLALQGMQLPFAAYPPYQPLSIQKQIPTNIAHAIARQESVFNPRAISRVGARGLMQLMPGTARLTAPKAHLAYTPRRLLSDPVYNSKLGSTYLAGLIEEFDGYLPMAVAGYNAGPHRVHQWLERYGDPRKDPDKIDPIDWIELIPFSETRNYVQRVVEALHVYSEKNPENTSKRLRSSGIIFPRPENNGLN